MKHAPLATLRLPLGALACAGLLSIPGVALAQDAPTRITGVKLYPGSATVERTARVAAGSRSVVFHCLPAGLDARSLQVQADAAVRIGDTGVQVRERALAGGCSSPLDERVRAAQDQVAVAAAEADALRLAHTYLKTVAGTPPTAQAAGPGTPGSAAIGATTESLRRSAQDTLVRLHQAQRRQEQLELELKALTAERDRVAGPGARVATVTVTLAAERDADVRLSYQVRGPSWSPSYRAALDSQAATVRLERLALVAQDTGEDWSGVPLTLSTGQPLRATGGRLPRPWTLDLPPEPPPPPAAPAPVAMAAAPMGEARARGGAMAAPAAAEPTFDVAIADTAYATEFTVPQRITVASGGQRVTLSLGAQPVPVQLVARTAPAQEAAAYLVALLPALDGVWPTGPAALYRDGTLVGQGYFAPGSADWARNGLSFGRDERLLVTVEPPREHTASSGLTGARTERTLQHAYRVESRHSRPVRLQVLDTAPVSLNEQITVESRYEPAPAVTAWNQQPGLIAWEQELPPAGSARVATTHVLRYAKDLRVRERR